MSAFIPGTNADTDKRTATESEAVEDNRVEQLSLFGFFDAREVARLEAEPGWAWVRCDWCGDFQYRPNLKSFLSKKCVYCKCPLVHVYLDGGRKKPVRRKKAS